MVFKHGDKAEGQWKDRLMDGFGVITYKNKSTLKGFFKNGKHMGECKVGFNYVTTMKGNGIMA